MKIYYIANARMPTEKAHGIQIAKMCEAFVSQGVDLTLVVPKRKNKVETVKKFYSLRIDIKITYLPTIDTYRFGRIGFIFGSISFMITSFFFVLFKCVKGENFIVYTVDMDTFSSSLLPLTGAPVYTEMHDGKPNHFIQRLFFRFLCGVITINQILASDFKSKFKKFHPQYLVEPNGVDKNFFKPLDKQGARKRLGITGSTPIILYVGRFYKWKGLEIIPEVAKKLGPSVRFYFVGGTAKEFENITQIHPEQNMFFVGGVPQVDVVWWIGASDIVLVVGTKRDRQSYFYTSPMKIFEYLLSDRLIIASETPAIREVVTENEVVFYTPDSASDFEVKLREVIKSPISFNQRIAMAKKLGRKYSWDGRAGRIVEFINKTKC